MWSEEEKARVINPKHTEIDDALLNLIQRFDGADSERKKEYEQKTAKKKEDLVKAQKVRNISLQALGKEKKGKAESEKKTSQEYQ